MRGLHRVLNMPEYALIMSQYVWICLDNAEYDWILLHIHEKNRVLNMSKFCMFLMNSLWNQGTSINILSKTQEKEAPQGNILEFFLLDTLKYTLWMENLTGRWAQSGSFFPKSGHFFDFQKGQGRPPFPPPSCAPVSVAEYASISLNMPKYPWKCLNKLIGLCQVSEYAWSSYIFYRVLKMPQVLDNPGFWIWHGCICKGYA